MTDEPADPILAQAQALERRRKRKAEKRKNALARDSFLTLISGSPDQQALTASMKALMKREGIGAFGEPPASPTVRPAAGPGPAPMAFAVNNTNRWVPIGPSVVRRGQADGRPRVSGRVRDLAVSPDGRRAYAGTAKGGVWYTGDGGATWEPVGGWANEPRRFGGHTSAFACGCLLVNFGADAGSDFVMVGTGEIGARQGVEGATAIRGVGVLSAAGPAAGALNDDPWETSAGIGVLEGVSITRMVRVPGSTAGADGDTVIAATSAGLLRGTRSLVSGTLQYTWTALNFPAAPASPPAFGAVIRACDPTDVCYVNARLFVCYRHTGVAFSDDNGTSLNWIAMNFRPAPAVPVGSTLLGRLSMAVNDDANRVYVLGDVDTNPAANNSLKVPHVWRIANPGDPAPVANPLNNVPVAADLWGDQRDYDQAIVVTTHDTVPPPGRTDRVYIGGSLIWVNNWNASIWAFDVNGNNLVPSPGVSDQPAGTTAGATPAGLIGDGVHPDVHALRKTANAGGPRQIWVGCDGGVFVSLRDGQTNTFSSRNVGLASIESIFSASHPTSSHFAMLGCQDNGRQVRVGNTVWELKDTMQGDGGGVTFHPVQSHYVMGQFTSADWACDPAGRYRAPCNLVNNDPEQANGASNFYSGINTVLRAAGNRARVALGTNRVWVTDNLGTSNPNTWRVLPITAAGTFVQWRDGRPGNRTPSTAANMAFGVPPAGFGPVVTVKWVDEHTLLALFNQGVIRYSEDPGNPGRWTSTALIGPGVAAPAAPLVRPRATFFTDIAPVPGTSDFYLVTTGQTTTWRPAIPASPTSAAVAAAPPTAAADACFYYDDAAGGCRLTGLGQALPVIPPLASSPIDPAYSVMVDPANLNTVYVGTSTAVWTSTRIAGNAHSPWQLFVNGLPEAVVQDLHIWQDPAGAATSPRLMRATLQSRGVWEVNLAAAELARTYVRVHLRDDRRMFPTPMENPRRRPGTPAVPFFASPDIVVRPEAPVATTPSFRGTNIRNGSLPYQLWTFQTAFRWIYPSVLPNGEWSDQFGDLVERHRRLRGIANPGSRRIDAALWNDVMANAQDENGSPGVYRAPWQNAIVPTLPGSEIDVMETVVPRRVTRFVWQVFRERSTVDVLLHHRDTRPVAANGAFAVLLWRSDASQNTLLATDCTNLVPYVRSLTGGAPQATPAGWRVALAGDGTPLNRLSVDLAARMPRAVSINVDFSGVPAGHRVLLLAIVGSTSDLFSAVPTGPVTSVEALVRNWPHAAARVVSVWPRPGNQLFP